MPEYSYTCDTDNGGCGHCFSVFQTLSQYKLLKRCPNCSKHKLIRSYEEDCVYSSTKSSTKGMTLGSLADKNTSKLSSDERESLRKKHNEYKSTNDKPLPKGMKRKKEEGNAWYKTSNFSDIKNMSETQKKNYIRTGKKNG